MPHIEKTAFEPKNTNGVYNGLGNVAGLFRSPMGGVMVPDDCPAGYLCMTDGLLPLDGYDAALNGNAWYFKPADGAKVDGLPADRTGIYAANTYRLESVSDGDSRYTLGLNTLGIPTPELERGTFQELFVGEIYKFGEGNFSSPPHEGDFVPIDGPLFGDGASEPPDEEGAVWGEVLRIEPFNDGPRFFGDGYCVKIFRNAHTGDAPTPPTPPTPGDETNFIHFLEGSSTSIPVPEGTASIRGFAFYRAPFTSITIPDSVLSIGASAFMGATQLTSLTIPDSVRFIGSNAFNGCTALETLIMEGPASDTVMVEDNTFAGCSALKNVTLSPSIEFLSNSLFSQCTSLEELVIPEGIQRIGSYTFNLCRNMKRITIPSTVISILHNTFQSCFALESITLPAGLTELGQGVFNGCTALASLDIPDGIAGLNQALCQNCSALVSVTIPEGATFINSYAFARTQLANVVIPSTITYIGNYAFVDVPGPLLCRFSEGAVAGAPWGCAGEIIYDYAG